MERHIRDLSQLSIFAEEFIDTLSPNDTQATLITLSGELGAGKTAFVKEAARHMGILEHITSPTFVLAKSYTLSDQAFSRLVHIDTYRLKEGENLIPIGFSSYLADPKTIIFLEWPERVQNELPPRRHTLSFTVAPDGKRTIYYD